MVAATETLTIRLPLQAMKRLRRVAEIADRPIELMIAETLQSTLPPLLDDLPQKFHADLRPLEKLSNDELRTEVFARMDDATQERHHQLQERNTAGTLSESEHQELDAQQYQADLLMYRKAYAALLLKWRGEHVPTVAELEAAEK